MLAHVETGAVGDDHVLLATRGIAGDELLDLVRDFELGGFPEALDDQVLPFLDDHGLGEVVRPSFDKDLPRRCAWESVDRLLEDRVNPFPSGVDYEGRGLPGVVFCEVVPVLVSDLIRGIGFG